MLVVMTRMITISTPPLSSCDAKDATMIAIILVIIFIII